MKMKQKYKLAKWVVDFAKSFMLLSKEKQLEVILILEKAIRDFEFEKELKKYE